jgi:hypothetical protein
MDRVVMEAIHIRLKEENFNRDNAFNLIQAWCPLTSKLANQKAEPGKEGDDPTRRYPVAKGRP